MTRAPEVPVDDVNQLIPWLQWAANNEFPADGCGGWKGPLTLTPGQIKEALMAAAIALTALSVSGCMAPIRMESGDMGDKLGKAGAELLRR